MEEEKKLMVRMPKKLHYAVKVKAAQEDTTMSEVIRKLLQHWLEEKPRGKPSP